VSDRTAIDALTLALADRYQVERELGRGGMATVYLARRPGRADPAATWRRAQRSQPAPRPRGWGKREWTVPWLYLSRLEMT